MTYGNLIDIFRQRFPELHPIDFRPLDPEFTKDLIGITVWLESGDTILWFPKEGDAE